MRRVPWTRQPPYPCPLDRHWISRGLVLAITPEWYATPNGVFPTIKVGSPANSPGKLGPATGFGTATAGNTNSYLTGPKISTKAGGYRSYIAQLYARSFGGGSLGRVFQPVSGSGADGSVSNDETMYIQGVSSDRLLYSRLASIGYYNQFLQPTSLALNVWQTIGFSHDQTDGASIVPVGYRDGIYEGTWSVTVGNGNFTLSLETAIAIGNRPSDVARTFDGQIGIQLFFDKFLSPQDHALLGKNPSLAFEPYTVFGMSPTYVTAQTLTQSSSYSNTNTFYTHTLAATVSLAQSARFDNSNGLAYSHTLTPGVRALTQSSRFDNANTLNYTHTLTPGVRALTQSARFDNSNSLAYTHTLAAAITLAQSSRYDNTNSLAYAHSLSASITLSQSSRFDNSNSLSYTHSISQVGGAQSLTQSARHDNDSTFYTHSLAAGAVGLTQSARFDNTNGLAYAHTLAASISLPQGARFDNANGLSYAHSLSASITLAQSARFDNSNGLAYQHSISQAGGTQSLEQSARYDNTNSLTYQHTVSAGTVTLDQSARFDNAAQFFAHTVVQAADQFIFPAYYENANGFYQHLIGDGSVEIASGGAFHPPRIDDPRKRRRRDDETLLVIGAI